MPLGPIRKSPRRGFKMILYVGELTRSFVPATPNVEDEQKQGPCAVAGPVIKTDTAITSATTRAR
jgi:hypothetical protein